MLPRHVTQAEHCQAGPASDRSWRRNRNGARCHCEAVGAPLAELQRRADDEARADAQEADANAQAAERNNGTEPSAAEVATRTGVPSAAGRSWRSLLEALAWQWQWMGRRPTAVAAAGWADQLRVGAVMVLYDDALSLVANLLPDLLASVHHTVTCRCRLNSATSTLRFWVFIDAKLFPTS